MIKIKTEEEIKIMAEGGKILSEIVKEVSGRVKEGITTKELDRLAEDLTLKRGAKPSFKSYNNFPATICSCVNEELVHCVPSSKRLRNGDILSIDMGIMYKGYHSDMAVTVPVGEISQDAARLIKVTKKALKRGIKKVRKGLTFGDVSNSIQRYAEDQGYGVIRDLTGHGIGKDLHEDPEIPNYGKRKTGSVIKEGMVFCLEPMIAIGDWKVKKAQDGHGYRTDNLSAHFEHTIAITKKGVRVLTNF